MWLGRGTLFPLTHGWRGGLLTGIVSALPVRTRSRQLAASTGEFYVLTHPAASQYGVCRDTSTDRDRRSPLREEAGFPQSALARGPPRLEKPLFSKWICEICCINNEKQMKRFSYWVLLVTALELAVATLTVTCMAGTCPAYPFSGEFTLTPNRDPQA